MTEQEKLKAKIEQNIVDAHKLDEERERLQDEFSELQELKLRQGDYGYYSGGGKFPLLLVKLGNIFDDFKRNSEDLEVFTVKTYRRNLGLSVGLTINPKDAVYFNIGTGPTFVCTHLELDKAIELHQKLGQLIATAKRKL